MSNYYIFKTKTVIIVICLLYIILCTFSNDFLLISIVFYPISFDRFAIINVQAYYLYFYCLIFYFYCYCRWFYRISCRTVECNIVHRKQKNIQQPACNNPPESKFFRHFSRSRSILSLMNVARGLGERKNTNI